jgi:GNAT superfamily N-acetyltransferase
MNIPIQVRDLRAEADPRLIEAIYHEILEPSFGSDELDTLACVLDGLTEGGSYECWGLAALDGETPVGNIMGYPYLKSGVLLIGYVAVRPGLRSRGIGDLLLTEAGRHWYGKAGLTLVLAEIDDPRYHPATADIDPRRRVAFYARHGTRIALGPYFQPRLEGEGKKRVYDMFLAVLAGRDGAIGPGPSVAGRQVSAFLMEYFTASGEGSDWPRADDAEGRWLLDWYRDRDMVGLQPIENYTKAEIQRTPGR